MICDRANILDISRRIDHLFLFFFVLPFIVLVFCDSFFLNSWKITLQLKYSILWRVHLFELSCYFIITQFLLLYFQWLYLRGTKLHNFHNFLTFSLYYMYYNSISTHSMFMSLKDLFKNISYIAFEEKISKFRKKKIISLLFISQLSRTR